MLARMLLLALLYSPAVISKDDDLTVPAVRVVRLQVEYPNASVQDIPKIHKWNSIMRNSVIASLRFINKHWLICGSGPNGERYVGALEAGSPEPPGKALASPDGRVPNAKTRFMGPANDCGKAHVTGEIMGDNHYRINATFISERDPIKNVKVEATSTVIAVSQIGLKGGIFQYTNALKVLGKPSNELVFDEAFFCYKGAVLVDGDKCRKELRVLRDEPIREREPIEIDRLIAL